MAIAVGIVDDHPTTGRGLAALVEEDPAFKVIFTVSHPDALRSQLQIQQPEVLISDLILPEVRGFELVEWIRKTYPDIHLAVITRNASSVMASHLMAIGARGLILKTQSDADIITAVRDIAMDKAYLPPEYRDHLQKLHPNQPLNLSNREMEILELVLAGKSSTDIGEQLFLSPKTVENHRANLFRKLEVKNHTELLRKAYALGLID